MHGLHNGCIGQYGIIFWEQLLAYPPKCTPNFPFENGPPKSVASNRSLGRPGCLGDLIKGWNTESFRQGRDWRSDMHAEGLAQWCTQDFVHSKAAGLEVGIPWYKIPGVYIT